MKKHLLTIILFALSCSAFADVKIPVKDELQLFSAIQALDGATQVVKIDGADKIVALPYKMSGKARLTLAKDLLLLHPVLEAAQNARQLICKQFSPSGKELKPDDPSFADFKKQIQAVDEARDSLPLLKISEADLDLDTNAIPPSVIAALDPILTH